MEFFSADGLAEEESKAHESIPWYPDHGVSNVDTKLTKELEIRLFAVLPNFKDFAKLFKLGLTSFNY